MANFKEPIINYWYRALHSPRGVELICSNPESIRVRLYTARKDSNDPDLKDISISMSPFGGNKLWLIKKNPVKEQP